MFCIRHASYLVESDTLKMYHKTGGKLLILQLLGCLNFRVATTALPFIVFIENFGFHVLMKKFGEAHFVATVVRGIGIFDFVRISTSCRELEGNVHKVGGAVPLMTTRRTDKRVCIKCVQHFSIKNESIQGEK